MTLVQERNKQSLITDKILHIPGTLIFLFIIWGLEYFISTRMTFWWSGLFWSVLIVLSIPYTMRYYRPSVLARQYYLARCIWFIPMILASLDLSFRFAGEYLNQYTVIYISLCLITLGFNVYERVKDKPEQYETVLNRLRKSRVINTDDSQWDISKEMDKFMYPGKAEFKGWKRILIYIAPIAPAIGMFVIRYPNEAVRLPFNSILYFLMAWSLANKLSEYIENIRFIRSYEKKTGKNLTL